MIDIEELERLAKAAQTDIPGHRIKFFVQMDPEIALSLIGEVRQLREDLQAAKIKADHFEASCALADSTIDSKNRNIGAIVEFNKELLAELEAAKMQCFDHETAIAAINADLQAAKLLAHANGEMFRAEKAECEKLRAMLATPIAMKIRWSPMSENMIDGFSEAIAHNALTRDFARARKVTVYYGITKPYEIASAEDEPLATD
jgi:hypothetical protein